MRIILTGGLGFLGFNFCKYLLSFNNEIIVIDRLDLSSEDHYRELCSIGIKCIDHNIIEPIEVEGKIDQIYHLASRASPNDYQKYPVDTALTNSIGTKNMLDLARRKNAKLLYTSSSEIYGNPQVNSQKEDYFGNVNPVGIRSCYAESKRFGEALLMAYHKIFKTDIKIVRIFNAYGPGMRPDDGRVISNFINQAIKNVPVTIHGDGTQTRSFCYIDDVIEGIYRMMNTDNFIGPVNIGNPYNINIKKLANMIVKLTNSKAKIIYLELPKDDPIKRSPDISLAKLRLNWEPKISLAEGLKRTIKYYKNFRRS